MHICEYMELALDHPREVFAALGDRLRLRLACCLVMEKDGLCVCELVDALDEPQPTISRHLRLMKAAGLAEERREGRWVYYRLKKAHHPFAEIVRGCLETVCHCIDVREDLRRLRVRLRLRRGGKCVLGFQTKKRR